MGWAKRHKRKNKLVGSFLMLPHAVLRSDNFKALSPKAVKLLLDIAVQYNGKNNGDLQATWRFMKPRGWKSRDTLSSGIRELLHYGFVEKTRQGYMNVCSLYALTWCRIDDCGDKFDEGIKPTLVGSGEFKLSKTKFASQRGKIASTEILPPRHGGSDDEARMAT